ncbi:hypothetical protein B7P43_G02286 [Cryptotermes secundus]|uniref:Endonuclease/exonuclease/phosphatase domain-containing protein n=1 Tax=Cryptotermes secundus TaxID=105785 RepID=A0A2J7R576_9NEOP|nr:hypothetical protein B7P43_G02286 [Cryptotermes secundus]
MDRVKDLIVATWNVRTLLAPGKLQEIADELSKYRIDFSALQEIRWQDVGKINKKDYTFYYGCTAEKTGQAGTGFILNQNMRNRILQFEMINEQIRKIRIAGKLKKITDLSVYFPTNDKDEASLQIILRLLLVIIGDFSAQIGVEDDMKDVVGNAPLYEISNDNGVRVVNFATSKNFTVKSTMYLTSPDGKIHDQIDHILIDRRRHSSLLDVQSFKAADCDTDHYLVVAKVRVHMERFNIKKLNEVDSKEQYHVEISNRFAALENLDTEVDVNKVWNTIRVNIKISVKESLGYYKLKKHKPWFYEGCSKLLDQRKQAKLQWLQDRSEINGDKPNNIRCETSRHFRNKKKEYNSKNKNIRDLCSGMNDFKRGYKLRSNLVKDENGDLLADSHNILNRWKNYFSHLLNVHSVSDVRQIEMHTVEPLVPDPSPSEVESAIAKLKRYKSPGSDHIPAELIQAGGEIL